MLAPIENGRRHEYTIMDPKDPLYHLIACVALIPIEEETVRESEAQFRADHHEIAAWEEYKKMKREYDEELEVFKQEEEEEMPRHSTDDYEDRWPTPPDEPTCTEPSAEYKKTFDERIAQFKGDLEFLGACRKRAFKEIVAHVDPNLYAPGVKGGVAHNAFCGHLGKRGAK